MKKLIALVLTLVLVCTMFVGCMETSSNRDTDSDRTLAIADNLQSAQPTPTDINYSLERYNLIRRAYWVNGQREKANTLPCSVEKPLGYIVLFTESGAIVNSFVVDGKVSSLNSYLTPDSEYYEIVSGYSATYLNEWLADVDGSYGANDDGIFFFTPMASILSGQVLTCIATFPLSLMHPLFRLEVNQ